MPPLPINNNLREQFVTEQIPVGFPWRLLIFSLILLGLSIFIYFGLRVGYESYLDRTAAALDKKIEELGKKVSREEQENLISFYSQFVNLKKVLDSHLYGSNIYGFLERNTLPTVYYYEAELLVDQGALELNGRADSLQTLTSQMTLFDKAPELEKIVLNQMSFEGREVGFGMTLVFAKEFFKSPKQ